MKRLLLAFILIQSLAVSAQSELSPSARIFRQELQSYLGQVANKKGIILPSEFIVRYDLIPANGGYQVGVLAQVQPDFDRELLKNLGIRIGSDLGSLLTLRVPLNAFEALIQLNGIRYLEAGSHLEPELERTRHSLRVDSVYMGLGDLSMPYTGKGVIVAIIDWGFDYTHPMFYDTTMSEYRVSRAWDQNKNSGPAPEKFGFGTEYVGMDELLAAGDDTLYVFGPGSHGTHVGGIAGGGGAGTRFRGIAPEAELIFISLKRDDPSFIDAIKYVADYAEAVNKPFVVNMSFGNHSGPHDGSTLRNLALDVLSGKGAVFVSSAGNNGGEFFHILHDFSGGDTIHTEVKKAAGLAGYYGETVNIWAEPDASFSVRLQLADPINNTVFYSSNWFSTTEYLNRYDTLYTDADDTLVLRITSEDRNFLNKKPNLLFECRSTGNSKIMLSVTGSGATHLWHIAQLDNRVTNWGQSFLASFPGAVGGDAHYSVGGPPAVSKEVITVAAYQGEATLPNGQETLGDITSFSSWGPTTDERVKPDIAGPGQNVVSSVNSFDPAPGTPTESVTFQGKQYDFVPYSGTSMSGPAVAGVIALMLQANPDLTAREVKEILRITARLDKNTGDIGPDGDLRWGWGKANAYAAVRLAEIKLGTAALNPVAPFEYYPNPAQGKVQVLSDSPVKLKVRSLDGKLLYSFNLDAGEQVIDLEGLSEGMYFLEWNSGDQAGICSLMIAGRP